MVCQASNLVQDGPHTVSRVRPTERQTVGLYTTRHGDYSQCYSWGPSASHSVLWENSIKVRRFMNSTVWFILKIKFIWRLYPKSPCGGLWVFNELYFLPVESCGSWRIIILYVGTCLPSYFLSPSPLRFLPISTCDYKISISPVMSQAYWIASQCVFKIYWNPILEIWCLSYFRLHYSYRITANQRGAK